MMPDPPAGITESTPLPPDASRPPHLRLAVTVPPAPIERRRLDDGRDVEVYATAEALADGAAAVVAAALREAVERRGEARVVLAGGSTPRALYARLAAGGGGEVPWARVVVLFGDERCVPPAHAASNYRMAQETLLGRVPVAPARVHRVHGELAPEAAADAYERTLRELLAPAGDAPLLDVVLLGVGADGHTASLFPGDAAVDERARWALPVVAPDYVGEPRERVTLTRPLLESARLLLFLVAGAEKRDAVARALGADATVPAGRLRAVGGTLWMTDAAAVGAPREGERRS